MPRLVDHDHRTAELADATLRVVRRHGVAAASVRAVATEAGVSAGSLRHFLPTQEALLESALRRIAERVEGRLRRAMATADPQHWIEELLPLDAERRDETDVWLAFSAHVLADDRYRPAWAATHEAMRWTCERALEALGVSADELTEEAARLHALVDGLAVHAALSEQLDAETLRAIVGRHLAATTRSATG